MFEKPDRRIYSAKPFWAWNGNLNKDELIRQVHIMKDMGFGGFFMHSRTGLETEYLGDEWFDLINACADEAEKLDMEAWLYDEDRWPSGSCGGMATVEEEYRMKYIRMNIVLKSMFEWSDDIISAFAADIEGINFSNCIQISKHTDVESLMCGKVIYFTVENMLPSATYNNYTYLDTLSKEATEHFISLTHEKYKEHCGDRLGKSIKGIFTDEPHRGALMSGFSVPNRDASNLCPYTPKLFDEFQKAFGYRPVSYTHLDVYKRQALYSIICLPHYSTWQELAEAKVLRHRLERQGTSCLSYNVNFNVLSGLSLTA